MGDKQESRQSPRDSVFRFATITLPGADTPLIGRVRDLCDGGARVELAEEMQPGMSIRIAIGDKPPLPATVAWAADGKCGIIFDCAKVPAAAPLAVCPDAAPTAGWMADMRDRYRR